MSRDAVYMLIIFPILLCLLLVSFMFPQYFPPTKLIRNDKLRRLVDVCLYALAIGTVVYLMSTRFT